uniref:Uncharacterized protein n=1 Tax=Timema shepardi TaxID=629360 RepID=A0A7R9B4W8_TIMSH|nr:unnamed protein product [Timema shepardi]
MTIYLLADGFSLWQSWHKGAARAAQRWADQCLLLTHDDVSGRYVEDFGSCGQNIFVSTHQVPWYTRPWFLSACPRDRVVRITDYRYTPRPWFLSACPRDRVVRITDYRYTRPWFLSACPRDRVVRITDYSVIRLSARVVVLEPSHYNDPASPARWIPEVDTSYPWRCAGRMMGGTRHTGHQN